MRIQDRVNSLKPYIIGIRFLETMTVVDTVLKDGWKIPTSTTIKTGKNDNDANYHMFFSDNDNVEVDNIIDFIESVIKINIERELKYELLKLAKD